MPSTYIMTNETKHAQLGMMLLYKKSCHLGVPGQFHQLIKARRQTFKPHAPVSNTSGLPLHEPYTRFHHMITEIE